MKLSSQNTAKYLYFPEIENTGLVSHGFSTRIGGVGTGPMESLNLSFTLGDAEENVRENYRRMAQALSDKDSLILAQNMVAPYQAHTTKVRRVGRKEAGEGITRQKSTEAVDGLITDEPGITLVSLHADCTPLFFVDPVKKAIGLSHSGWKGTAGKMGEATIKAMENEFGCTASDLLVGVGPCICEKCYEVGEDVYEEFAKSFSETELTEIFKTKGTGAFEQLAEEKYFLNLRIAHTITLETAGVRSKNIFIAQECTYCRDDLFFSHRRQGSKRGSMAAFLQLQIFGKGYTL
ncbi:MAG: peptidoglycan editing factor PgeF [Anaerovoracaceae bacterium]